MGTLHEFSRAPRYRRRIVAATASAAQRSVITNDPRRMPGLDMRSPAGRRYRDIVDSVISKFGSEDTEAVRELASLKLTLEQTQALAMNGDQRARTDVVRLLRMVEKREAALRQSAMAARVKASTEETWGSTDEDEE
jgi:hypothetical protein